MKSLSFILLLALATLGSSSLLEMSQVLWTRVLGGGYKKIGKLDPLNVPVIKVDQSEGNMTYRVILRNLEVTGLNDSKIESFHIVKGKLKSNLSDNEAGYVSYNEQRDLDSIRYRFHTLIKEPKPKGNDYEHSASEQMEKIVEYDPKFMRARDEDDLSQLGSQDTKQQRYYANIDEAIGSKRDNDQQQKRNRTYEQYSGDMGVATKPIARNPSTIRVIYAQNYRNIGNTQMQGEYARPCIGACKPIQDSTGRVETSYYPSQKGQYTTDEKIQARVYQDQQYNSGRNGAREPTPTGFSINAQHGGSNFSIRTSNEQRQNQFSFKGGSNSGNNYSANRNGQISAEGQKGENAEQRQNRFEVKGGSNSGINYSGNYRNGQILTEGSTGHRSESNGERQNYFAAKGEYPAKGRTGEIEGSASNNYEMRAQYGGSTFSAGNSGMNFKNSRISIDADKGSHVTMKQEEDYKSAEKDSQPFVYYREDHHMPMHGEHGKDHHMPMHGEHDKDHHMPMHSEHSKDHHMPMYDEHGKDHHMPMHGEHSKDHHMPMYDEHSKDHHMPMYDEHGKDHHMPMHGEHSKDHHMPIHGEHGTAHYIPIHGEYGKDHHMPMYGEHGHMCNEEHERIPQASHQSAQRIRLNEQHPLPYAEAFEARPAPMIRLEKQPGYVDIVYASENKNQGIKTRSGSSKTASKDDPRVYQLEEIIKELRDEQRYIIHNFTEGESLKKRNDAARTAAETKRIKDLLRYAKEYQEKQGFYEEGMELIFHIGDMNSTSGKTNETLSRKKRQHVDDKEEEDVMHVIVRVRVPKLSVKSDYGLMGKVGKRLLRGNGLLAGNFTDVIADFTVELKKVDNKTMIVRAARAKLVSKDRNVRLQGMDETGPIQSILDHSLMAAEAVAAMIADDLATKALNEGNADGMIYKMYKSLPVIEKA